MKASKGMEETGTKLCHRQSCCRKRPASGGMFYRSALGLGSVEGLGLGLVRLGLKTNLVKQLGLGSELRKGLYNPVVLL